MPVKQAVVAGVTLIGAAVGGLFLSPISKVETDTRTMAAMWPAWADAGVRRDECAGFLVAYEPGEDAGGIGRRVELVRVCGPAPARPPAASARAGSAVRVVDSVPVFASIGALAGVTRGASDLLIRSRCACRPSADKAGTCVVPGDAGVAPAPLGTTLSPGWSGACSPKACVEAAEVADRAGLGYSMPEACK